MFEELFYSRQRQRPKRFWDPRRLLLCVPRVFFRVWGDWGGDLTTRLHLPSAEIKNECCYTSTLQYAFRACTGTAFFGLVCYLFLWHLDARMCFFFFCPMPPHVLVDFVVLPPGHGRSVTDFWGSDAHESQLRCPDDVSGDRGRCSARRALKPKFYESTQTMVTAGILPFRENSHGRAGNRTRDLMISSQRLWPLRVHLLILNKKFAAQLGIRTSDYEEF